MSQAFQVAIAQLKPAKGHYESNLARLAEVIGQLARLDEPPRVVQFAETILSGYFVEGGVREVAVTAGQLAGDLDRALDAAGPGRGLPAMDVVVGFYERWRGILYNSAAYLEVGAGSPVRVVHVHRKGFLPTYGLFDEERFVERGLDFRAFDTGWGRAAMLVCEDAWHSLPGTIVALDDADVVFVLSAAPARGAFPVDGDDRPASTERWDRLLRELASEHGVHVSFANLVGSEGGKVFAGCSALFGPRGDVLVRAPLFDEAVVLGMVEAAERARARADAPLIADLRVVLPHLGRQLELVQGGRREPVSFDGAGVAGRVSGSDSDRDRSGSGPPPRFKNAARGAKSRNHSIAVPIVLSQQASASDPLALEIDCELVERWLLRFLRDEMERRSMTRAVVGLSGGVDSAVTATLAARALGPANVLAVRLPYRTSNPDSLEHAGLVIDQLGLDSRTIDISAAVDGYLCAEPDASASRRGNVMARLRMTALFDLSAASGGIPLGTGNKSERLLGYFTWHADDSPPINPLGDLFKTQVWALARHLGVPDVIVRKPASADLIAGQTDEEDFGIAYSRADAILNALTSGYLPAEVAATGYTAAEVELVRHRLESTHWKRRLPTVALLSHSAIGESYLRPVDY